MANITKKVTAKKVAKSAPTKATKGSTSSKAVKKIGTAGANAIKRTTTFVKNRIDDPRELAVTGYKLEGKVANAAKNARAGIQYAQDKKMFGPTVAENLRKNPVNGKEGKALRLGLAQQDVITTNARRQQQAKKKSKQTGPVKEKGAAKRTKK